MQKVSGLITGLNYWIKIYVQRILSMAIILLINSFQPNNITLRSNSFLAFPQEVPKATVRGDTSSKKIALVFTGHEFADGGDYIADVLKKNKIKASFFLTGDFYRNKSFKPIIQKLKNSGNFLGSHSDKHLLYCDWTKRDSLLVTKKEFTNDLIQSFIELKNLGIDKKFAKYFLPPYEWYNDSIVKWTVELGLQLINFTPGTKSTADYTFPEMGSRYVSSETILQSIFEYEKKNPSGLNGFILLLHAGTDPRRKDKFYHQLPRLIDKLRDRSYSFVRIDDLLK